MPEVALSLSLIAITINHMTQKDLRFTFLTNVKYLDGLCPFAVEVEGTRMLIYIKSLASRILSKDNHSDIQQILLPAKEDLKGVDSIVIPLGYDAENEVFASWNPYRCTQGLGKGKSMSFRSKYMLQQRARYQVEVIKDISNEDGLVVYIPKEKIGEYIANIKTYYPEGMAHANDRTGKYRNMAEAESPEEVFKFFKSQVEDTDRFYNFLLSCGLTRQTSNSYLRHIQSLIQTGYLDKHKETFIKRASLDEYDEAVSEFLSEDEMRKLDKDRFYSAALRQYLRYLKNLREQKSQIAILSEEHIKSENGTTNIHEEYPLDIFGKLESLDEEVKLRLVGFANEKEQPDYDSMIEIVTNYYPKRINYAMSPNDWINLFKSVNWKEVGSVQDEPEAKPKKQDRKTLKVTLKNGAIIQYPTAADTYAEVIKQSYPDLIMELDIRHAGVNIVSKERDKRYFKSQRDIGNGFLVMTNSSTEVKRDDLLRIKEELGLDYKVEIVDKTTQLPATVQSAQVTNNSGREKIRVEFPNGKIICHPKVLETLLEVIEYAGPERVAKLNISVDRHNLVLKERLEKYWNACKPVRGGWYVNTNTDTNKKINQIRQISGKLNLNLIVKRVPAKEQ